MNHQQPDSAKCTHRFALFAMGVAALCPFVFWHSNFAQLFWFGDEWQLLAEIKSSGFWHWIGMAFAENVVPVFKILWGGCALVFNGNYFLMLLLLWLVHASNVVLFGRLLLRNGFSLLTAITSQILFALTPHNLETLGWSVQLSPVLSTTFFLLAVDHALRLNASTQRQTSGFIQTLLHSSLSALSFSRGVLTGPVTAIACLLSVKNQIPPTKLRRLGRALLCLLPALGAALLIKALASGNHQNPGGHFLDAADYGLWLFCMNPLFWIISLESWGLHTFALLAVLKLTLIVWSLWRANPAQRRLFAVLLIFELTNAALVGLGRYHTGLGTTISSRYQYVSLIAYTPFLALWLENLLKKVPATERYPRVTAILFISLLVFYTSQGWSNALGSFAETRGTVTRRILFVDPSPPEQSAIPGIPSLSTADAKQLVKDYNLH